MTVQPEGASPLVPTLETPHERGRDLIWCASLDLAWAELCALVGGPVTLRDASEDGAAVGLVRTLNASPVTRAVADPRSYVALAGRHTEAWVRRVEAELRERFGEGVETQLFERSPRPDLFVAYAFMAKAWVFATPLMRGHGQIRVGGVPVETFGLWETRSSLSHDPASLVLHEARADELLVHFHRFGSDDEPDDYPSEEFLVELVTQDRGDRLLVAKLPPQPTLAASVQWALARLQDDLSNVPEARLGPEERLEVPCIDFDLTRRYGELEGHAIACPALGVQAFSDVLERVRFRLDEGGALLRSEARLGGLGLPPRSMVCHPPFLVLLVRRGSPVPFLALWIETPALLQATPPR